MKKAKLYRTFSTSCILLFILLGLLAVQAAAQEPWQTPQGRACIERWISVAESRLNSYKGTQSFNDNKPWYINKYGITAGKHVYSAYAPDDFRFFNNDRLYWIWAHYRYDDYTGWPDPNWNGARVPPIRSYVYDCIREAGSTGGGDIRPTPTPPPPTGNACGFYLGSGIYNKWLQTGGENGFLGCPNMNEAPASRSPQGTTGQFAEFRGGDGGYILWHGSGTYSGRAFEVHGCIFKLYKSIGGTTSWLGFPISDEFDVPGGRESNFEGGFVHWDASTGRCNAYKYADRGSVGGGSGGSGDSGGSGNLLETLVLANDKPEKYTSRTVLQQGRWYTIEASGVFSDWGDRQDGVDAVWNYTNVNNLQNWQQLRIDEKGMAEITGQDIPYNPQHVYRVRYQGQGKAVLLYLSDAQWSHSDNSGSLTVKIYD